MSTRNQKKEQPDKDVSGTAQSLAEGGFCTTVPVRLMCGSARIECDLCWEGKNIKIETKEMVQLAKDAAMFLMERLVTAGPSGKLRFSDDPFIALSGFPFHLFTPARSYRQS